MLNSRTLFVEKLHYFYFLDFDYPQLKGSKCPKVTSTPTYQNKKIFLEPFSVNLSYMMLKLGPWVIRNTFFSRKNRKIDFALRLEVLPGPSWKFSYTTRLTSLNTLIPIFDAVLRPISRRYLVTQFRCQITTSRDSIFFSWDMVDVEMSVSG